MTTRAVGDVTAFYARGLEQGRLESGQGALEFLRTQVLLERHLPAAPAEVLDVGGGPGRYAIWLAERGYRVHLIDLSPLHVEQASRVGSHVGSDAGSQGGSLASVRVGDARSLDVPDASVDAVLLLGPLYHLQERDDRVRALAEARRVCRSGGVVLAAAVSRFASALDGLRCGHLSDPTFAAIAERDLRDGRHDNPTGHPAYFTTAYFHEPEELAQEFAAAGLAHGATLAVEGPAWLLPDLQAWLDDSERCAVLLRTLALLEAAPALMGASAHLLAVGRR